MKERKQSLSSHNFVPDSATDFVTDCHPLQSENCLVYHAKLHFMHDKYTQKLSAMQDLTDAAGRNAASSLLDTLLQRTDW